MVPAAADLPSWTPAHEAVGAVATPTSVVLGLPAPNADHGDIFDIGASSTTALAPSPARGHFVVPRTVLERAGAARRPEKWSPASLGLANGDSEGVVPRTQLPGGSFSDEEDGTPGPSTPHC